MIRRFKLGRDVELEKRTLRARAAVASSAPTRAGRPRGGGRCREAEHAHAARARSAACRRGWWSPTRGVDVLCDAERRGRGARRARRARRRAGRPRTAAEIVRVESGRPRFGLDLDAGVRDPAGGRAQRARRLLQKGCYVGQETVARLHYRGKPNRHLRGLRLSAPVEPGAVLRLGEREVGTVTSPLVSPALGPIALALVRREAEPGAVRWRPAGDGAHGRRDGNRRRTSVRHVTSHTWRTPPACSWWRAKRRPRTTSATRCSQRAQRGPIAITLLMPAPSIGMDGREAARAGLDAALEKLRAAGLDAEGVVGDSDPVEAVLETWVPGRFDEVVVATLPGASSRWLAMDLPHRVVADLRRARHARDRQGRRALPHRAAAAAPAGAARPAGADGLGRGRSARPRLPTRTPPRAPATAAGAAPARARRARPASRRRGAPRRAPPAAASRRGRSPPARPAAPPPCGSPTSARAPGSRAQSTTRPPTIHSASARPRSTGCGATTSRAPAWTARSTPPRRPTSVSSRSRRRRSAAARLVAAPRRRLRHPGVHVVEQRARRRRARRGTAAARPRAARGTGSGPGRRGTATGSGPSARRPTASSGAACAARSGAGRTAS